MITIAREYVAIMDTSHMPARCGHFAIVVLVVGKAYLNQLATSLRTIREMNTCKNTIHFTDLDRDSSESRVAHQWVQFVLRASTLRLGVHGKIVPPDGFSLSHSGGRIESALNRVAMTALKSAVSFLGGPRDRLQLDIAIDGSGRVGSSEHGLGEYLATSITRHAARSQHLPRVAQSRVLYVPKRPEEGENPLAPLLRDAVAVADLIAGGARLAADCGGSLPRDCPMHWIARTVWAWQHFAPPVPNGALPRIQMQTYRFPTRDFLPFGRPRVTLAATTN